MTRRTPIAAVRSRRVDAASVGPLEPAALCAFVMALVVMLSPQATFAHEFGPFAIDRYAALRVAPDEIELDYVLSLAETPTQADGDSIEADVDAYCTSLSNDFVLAVDGNAVDSGQPHRHHASRRRRRRTHHLARRLQLGDTDRAEHRDAAR